ncbi:MAG: hypothetical protein NVSMB13_06030 [Mycobacteriales bacterium]
MRMPRARVLAPLLVAAAVGITVSAVTVAAHRGNDRSGRGAPTPLNLIEAPTDAPRAMSVKVPGELTPGGGFRLGTALPTDAVRAAPVYRLPPAPAAETDVRRLAAVLGLAGRPEHAAGAGLGAGGWRLRNGLRFLSVADSPGWPWQLVTGRSVCRSDTARRDPAAGASEPLTCIAIPPQIGPAPTLVAPAPGIVTALAVPPAPPSGLPPQGKPLMPDVPPPPVLPSPVLPQPVEPPPPVRSVGPASPVQAAAARVWLDRLGLGSAAVRTDRLGSQTQAAADPLVDGLPTAGWTTVLRIDDDGMLDNGHGWLGKPLRGSSYPVISATAAFDRLARMPRRLGQPCRVDGEGLGCASALEQEVTGARRGLTLSWEASKSAETPLLVPAWLFTVSVARAPIAVVAVQDR